MIPNSPEIDIKGAAADYDCGGLDLYSQLRRAGAAPAAGDTSARVSRNHRQLVSISRKMEQSNLLCRGVVNRAVDHVIGPSGWAPEADTNVEGVNRKIEEELWPQVAEDPELTGRFDWGELQELVLRDAIVAGDQLLNVIGGADRDSGRVQHIESRRIGGGGLRRDTDDGRTVDKGRVLNDRGQTVEWRIADVGDHGYVTYGSYETLDADNTLYVSSPYHRSSQTRGYPIWISALPIAHQVEDILSSEAISWQVASRILASVKDSEGHTTAPIGDDNSVEREDAEDEDVGRSISEVGAAMIFQGRKGESFELKSQDRPSSSFAQNIRTYISMFCIPLGVPAELVTYDFDDLNYSNFRGLLLQAYISFRRWQKRLAESFCAPFYRRQVDRWIADGDLVYRPSIYQHHWNPPGWPWIDEVKEMEAWSEKIDRGIATQSQALSKLGQKDAREQRRKRADEIIHAAEQARRIEQETDGLVQAETLVRHLAGMDQPKTALAKLEETLREDDTDTRENSEGE